MATSAAAIAGKLSADGAGDLSDATLEGILGRCVAPTRLVERAKELRDSGLLTVEMLAPATE